MNWRAFFSVLTPILLTFISGRLIQQTDILMLSSLGVAARAALVIPTNIMLLDAIFGFAMAPVISVHLGRFRDDKNLDFEVKRCLRFCASCSLILVLLGLLLYPFLVKMTATNVEVLALAKDATFWLTLAIPGRLIQFGAAMALHGLGRGKELIKWSLLAVTLNALLNWILIFGFNLGFKGSYISTFAVTWLSLGWTLLLLGKSYFGFYLFNPPDWEWSRSFLKQVLAEFSRICSGQMAGFVSLFLYGLGSLAMEKLSVFGVACALENLIFVPFLATTRASSIYLARQNNIKDPAETLKPVKLWGFALCCLIVITILVFAEPIGKNLYHLDGEALRWWKIYSIFLAFQLPVSFLNTLSKSIWQYRAKFNLVSRIDIVLCWFVLMPVLSLGSYFDNPWLTWSAYGLMTFGTWAWLRIAEFRLNQSPKTNLSAAVIAA